MNCKKNVKSRSDDEHRLFDPAVEKVVELGLERLRPFENHPFKVKEDEAMARLMESIERYGIMNPLIVMPTTEGFYRIISGHRRKYCAEKLGYTQVPVIIRYIRLTSLIPELLDMLDEGKISFNPAVELSFLSIIEQGWVADSIEYTLSVPSVSQAKRMKALSQEKQLSPQKINEILNEIKKTDMSRVIFKNSQMYKYFPKYYSTEQMKEEIIELLEKERKRKEREKGRKKRMGREI